MDGRLDAAGQSAPAASSSGAGRRPSAVAEAERPATPVQFSAAEIGAIAHLYRGEVYRSTIWRTRLDNTTNWAVVTTGIALSLTFSGPQASALPIVLVGVLAFVFLFFEARRYRYFNVWRARARLLETDFYAPLLRGQGVQADAGWTELLARDYVEPEHHITLARALGRRLRRSYGWILLIQVLAYYSKLAIHPVPLTHAGELVERAAIGPLPGWLVVIAGIALHGGWIAFALVTWRFEVRDRRRRRSRVAMG